MDFLTVLQTHTLGDSQHYAGLTDRKRYGSDSKLEIVKRCVRSLVASIEYCKKLYPQHSYRLIVLDDHSDEQGIEVIKQNLARATFSTQLEHLETRGIMPSILACYKTGRDQGKDLVYFAQDDYLFEESAIEEMIDAYYQFSRAIGNHVCIFPYNDPYKYQPFNLIPSRIVQGQYRHWRTITGAASCIMAHVDVIRKEWDLFDAMGNHKIDPHMEDNTINKMFSERGYYLFSPIPSLALHFQYDVEKDPYIKWQDWWDKWADPYVEDPSVYNDEKLKILNVGCGTSQLDFNYFDNWRELRVDLDQRTKPDIVDTIIGLPKTPDQSVDAVWASHVLEHIYWHEIPTVLAGFNRVLKPHGYAIIRTPNLETIADRIANDLLGKVYDSPAGPVATIDMIYGHRGMVQRDGDFMSHKTGFTSNSMAIILDNLGYKALLLKTHTDLITVIYKNTPPWDVLKKLAEYYSIDNPNIIEVRGGL